MPTPPAHLSRESRSVIGLCSDGRVTIDTSAAALSGRGMPTAIPCRSITRRFARRGAACAHSCAAVTQQRFQLAPASHRQRRRGEHCGIPTVRPAHRRLYLLRLQVRKPGATDTKALSREHVVDIVDGHLLTIAGGRPCGPFPMSFCAPMQRWSQRVPRRATAYAQNRTGARRT